ncbi:MAG: OmpA family protein [Rickettsiales bacterium]|jgi:chemotaxis protein MotB|nr:OmpA family protein [Rickettsiales bacterium]
MEDDSKYSNLWPSFVDVMSNMFILMLFIAIVAALATTGAHETGKTETLGTVIEFARKEKLKNKLNSEKISELGALVAELDGNIIRKENQIKSLEAANLTYKNQIERLGTELRKLNDVFETTDKYIKWQKVQIVELGKKLNRALANKTAELVKVRSDFFDMLLKSLKNNRNFQIVGDRFVLPSEVLFKPESAQIEPEGMPELDKIAENLTEAMVHFPGEADWILRVDGHTDSRPIRPNSRYKSNWELSAARAMSVVEYLISRGVPASRLAAAGFGEYHPVSKSHAQNRRIEFKLTEK